jgi:hypothetical protein
MRDRLAKLKLALHPDKSRLIQFGQYSAQRCRERRTREPATFNFLGFTLAKRSKHLTRLLGNGLLTVGNLIFQLENRSENLIDEAEKFM